MTVPEIRPHRAFIAVSLLPLLEPLCAFLAYGEGSPVVGRIAGGWLAIAPGFQLLAIGLALLAITIAVMGLFGERESPPQLRFWSGVALAGFFSVASVHIWYPANVERAARNRSQAAVDSTRDAVQRYVKRHRVLPVTLAALVPDYVSEVPNPRVAGSHLTYRKTSVAYNLFELTVPGPGGSKPLARFEARESLLQRVLGAAGRSSLE